MTSLRARVALGAILWSIGLLAFGATHITLFPHALDHLRLAHVYFRTTLALAGLCTLAGFLVVRGAIQPLERIRRRLGEVRSGSAKQLEGRYPSEVQPLVDDLNALLAHNEQMITRANARAGDLAHGLKTPLAILSNEATTLGRDGDPALAASIAEQVALMRRQVDYHLAHARAAAAGRAMHAPCSILESADGLRRTLLRLHAQRGLRIDVNVPADRTFRGRREDLDEMLGNLLDNACKWARTRVTITATQSPEALAITIEDDGPGLDESMRERVLQRGVRADEAAPGSGLGLAIVRDIAEVYGGSVTLDRSPQGGLAATLRF